METSTTSPAPVVNAREWWDLDQIGVTVSHRKRGICRALLLKVISEASAKKVREIELSSWAFNTTARRAFEKLGFVPKVVRYELPELGGNKDCSP